MQFDGKQLAKLALYLFRSFIYRLSFSGEKAGAGEEAFAVGGRADYS